jgi:CDP-diacylglycerol--glycerol-3-phosphate 3-phosphatidyltransferase
VVTRAQIPNLLTFARVVAVPAVLLIILLAPAEHAALFFIFLAATATDFLDGYLARKWKVTSDLGALLDPIADKLLVVLMLLYLMVYDILSLLPVSVIILRELYISGLREFLAMKKITLSVSAGGKLKTSLQMTGILLMMLGIWQGHARAEWLGEKVIWLAAAFALGTAWDYTAKSWKHLK